jgi:hypothetical protein
MDCNSIYSSVQIQALVDAIDCLATAPYRVDITVSTCPFVMLTHYCDAQDD